MLNQQGDLKTNLLVAVEKAYKKYNFSLLILLIFLCLRTVISSMISLGPEIVAVIYIVNVAILIFALYSVYEITKLLKVNGKDRTHPVLWVIAMFLPLFNLIAILLIYSKTRRFLKELRSS